MSHEYVHKHIIYTDRAKNPLTSEALREETARSKFGCFTRALEFALGAEATGGEWGLRLRHLKRVTAKMDFNPLARVGHDEQVNIESFFAHLARSATPLGQAFRSFDLTETVISGKQVKRIIRQGNKVILPISFRDGNNKPTSNHFAHISRAPFGVLRRSSDKGTPKIKLKTNHPIDALVFSPKNK